MNVESRYLDGTYLRHNPDWSLGDAAWKASLVADVLARHQLHPSSLCEVGCGAGGVLLSLRRSFPEARLAGFDVSPQAAAFWEGGEHRDAQVEFVLGDFHTANTRRWDVVLMLDVFEHVRDPFTFLEATRKHGSHFVFHVPLDLSAASVARRPPLLEARRTLGHLHFYTLDLALETLRECGFEVVSWRYTEAALSGPGRTLKTRLGALPRRLAYAVDKDWGVRLLGGETLLVLAR